MDGQIRVNVYWSSGGFIPVRIGIGEPAANLIELVKRAARRESIRLIAGGAPLDPNQTLSEQNISNNCCLIAQFQEAASDCQNFASSSEKSSKERLLKNIQSVYNESLRIHDLRLSILDSIIPISSFYLPESDSDEVSSEDENDAFIGEKPTSIPESPLPNLWEPSPEQGEYETTPSFLSGFKSIEEAGSFFSNHKWLGWIW